MANPPSVTDLGLDGDLAAAVESISNKAEEDSLLRDPYKDLPDDPFHFEEFVSPLSNQDKKSREDYRIRVRIWESELRSLTSSFDQYDTSGFVIDFQLDEALEQAFFGPRINWLKFEIARLRSLIANINRKEAQAYAAWHARYVAALKKYQEERRDRIAAVTEQIEDFTDKFEEFRTQGIDGLRKRVRPRLERIAKNYVRDEPDLLFVAEYFVADKFVGVLVCFQKYKGSTHYEIFKNDVFRQDVDFERILLISRADLAEESKNFLPYVRETLGFRDLNEGDVFIFLDTDIKVDRIYEYQIAAAKVPSRAAAVDYDMILESKDQLNKLTLSNASNVNLFTYSELKTGNRDYAWTLAIANETFSFFGSDVAESSLRSIMVNPELTDTDSAIIYVPKSLNDVMEIFKQAVGLLGLTDTLRELILRLGGFPTEFFPALYASIDDELLLFSFDEFKKRVTTAAPVFELIAQIAETADPDALASLSTLSLQIPNDTGSINPMALLGLTEILRFINEMMILVTNAQDEGTFSLLVDIRTRIAINRDESPEDITESAISEFQEEAAAGNTTTATATSLNVTSGFVATTEVTSGDDSDGGTTAL